MRRTRREPLIAILLCSCAPAREGSTPLPVDGPNRTAVTVSQGTSMSVAVSPDGRSLAIDLQGTIWVLPAGGGSARPIIDHFHDARQPSWSPDGSTIVFQGYRAGNYDIWAVSPDGGRLRQLTNDAFDDREPAWSHDGTRIAFSSDRGAQSSSGTYDIWLLDVRTSRLQQLTRDASNDEMPSWSPDDSEIAFASSGNNQSGIFAVSVTTGAERQLRANGDAPSWGPGGQLAYHITADGTSRLMLGDTVVSSGNVSPFRAAWASPSRFYYVSDGHIHWYTLERPGSVPSGALIVTDGMVRFTATLPILRAAYTRRVRDFESRAERPVVGILSPQVSPDGNAIVFGALGDIWIRRTNVPERLTQGTSMETDPAWSPDGTRIAYASDRGGGVLNLWLRDLATGSEQQLTWLRNPVTNPAWSRDGKRIAFLEIDGQWRRAGVSVVDVASGEVSRIHPPSFGPSAPSWSPDGRYIAIAAVMPYSTRFREGINQILLLPTTPGARGTRWIAPTPHAGIDSRAGAGPVWSPDGKSIAFVQGGLLSILPVDENGDAAGPPRTITREIAHAPSWTSDARRIVYQSNDRLRIVEVGTGQSSSLPLTLTYQPAVPTERVVVHAGRLFDGVSPATRHEVDILIDGNRITQLLPHEGRHHENRLVVDATGMTVLPGLIEYHSHLQSDLGASQFGAWLAFGITTVRSPGGTPYEAAEQREAIESGARIGPRIFSTGYLLEWGRAYYKMSVAIRDDEHLERELERARALQHDLLKSYVRMPDRQQRRIVEFAHAMGVPASSHEIFPSSSMGIDAVEHTTGTSRRGYSPKVSALGRSYSDVTTIIGAARMTLTPTFALSSTWLNRVVDHQPALAADPRFALLPDWLSGPVRARRPAAASLTYDAGAAGELVRNAQRAGARIVAGTDTPNPASLHGELLAYVSAGLTPFQALQAATVTPAVALGLDAGSIEAGKLADLVIVDGDPLTDITHTTRVRTVVANGRVFDVNRLLAK